MGGTDSGLSEQSGLVTNHLDHWEDFSRRRKLLISISVALIHETCLNMQFCHVFRKLNVFLLHFLKKSFHTGKASYSEQWHRRSSFAFSYLQVSDLLLFWCLVLYSEIFRVCPLWNLSKLCQDITLHSVLGKNPFQYLWSKPWEK